MKKFIWFVMALVMALMVCVGCAPSAPVENNGAELEEEVQWVDKSEWPAVLLAVDELVTEQLADYNVFTCYDGEDYYCIMPDFNFSRADVMSVGLDKSVMELSNWIYDSTGIKASIGFYDSSSNPVLIVYDGMVIG